MASTNVQLAQTITCAEDLDQTKFDELGNQADDAEHDHILQAGRAAGATKHYALSLEEGQAEVDWAVTDLLISLRHLTDVLGLDYEDLDREAFRAYRKDRARAERHTQ